MAKETTNPNWPLPDRADPARNATAVTPDDANDISTGVTRGLYVGGAGNLVLIMAMGQTVTFTNIQAGSILPLAVARVKATLTTATNIVALW